MYIQNFRLFINILIMYICSTGNFTTNLAESYMNVRAKFNGGKQINKVDHCRKDVQEQDLNEWTSEGPTWGPATWGKVVSAPCTTFTKVAESM